MESAPSNQAELLAKAQRLEEKKLFVKAAEVYKKIGQEDKAAKAYEDGGAFEEAAGLYEKLGQKEKAEACRKKLEESKNPQTWSDLQADFVSDYPG
ncbi:MAG: CLH domain-containing protein [Candidatus Marsarchaeota archaeon]|nr:CLH domain-containing protein [Candidatus Marsarchaeota archaeon]